MPETARLRGMVTLTVSPVTVTVTPLASGPDEVAPMGTGVHPIISLPHSAMRVVVDFAAAFRVKVKTKFPVLAEP